MSKVKDKEIDGIISKAVTAGLKAGRLEGANRTQNAYKDTERRLSAYCVLKKKIESDTEKLQDLKTYGLQETSKGITRYSKSGSRLSKDEILEALIQDLEVTIQIDTYEVDMVTEALEIISSDTYFVAIEGKYIRKKHDDELASEKHCDPSTIRRNRGRLMRELAVWFYGVQAL